MSIIIKNAVIYGEGGKIITGNSLFVDKNKIVKITSDKKYEDTFKIDHPRAKVIDAKGKLLMPGFYNSHTHSPMNIFRNYGSDLTLNEWLFGKIIPKEQMLTPEDTYWGSLAGQSEMIRSGCTGFADMYEPFQTIYEAARDGGLRACICVAPLTNKWNNGVKTTLVKHDIVAKQIEETNHSCGGRINTYVELHSIYLYIAGKLINSVELAKKYHTGIHMHLHETEKEINDSLKDNGMRPFDFFEKIGAFDVPTIAAHCVHFTSSEIERAAKYGINVVTNSSSNLKLASGIAPIPEMIDKGVHVSIGTDGAASNNNLNIAEEMHLTSLIHKGVTKDPLVLPARKVIQMATEEGARALGFGGRAGVIKEKMLADMIIVDFSGIHTTPVNDYASAIVYSMQGCDVDTVIVDGKVLMENRKLKKLDEEKIKWHVNKTAEKLDLK